MQRTYMAEVLRHESPQGGDKKVLRLSVRLLVGTFYTKKSHKIHYSQQSIKIRRILNTNRQILSCAKS